MKKSIYFFLTVFVLVGLFSGISIANAANPVVLKTVIFVPKSHPLMTPTTFEWLKMLNEGLKGKAEFKFVGGPEAIPSREQMEAVRNNVVQVTLLPTAYYKTLLPSAASLCAVQFKNAMEMRKSPYHDFLIKEHKKIGVRYIGPGLWGGFNMWVVKPVKDIGDLKGIKMRTMSLYDRFQKALGIIPVTIPTPEVYTALERGVVGGVCFPQVGPRDLGWTKKMKYIIAHQFYSNDITMTMNLATWNKLPKDVQDKIEEITAKQYEPYMAAYAEAVEKKEWVELEKAGVEKVIFPPSQAKKFIDTAYRLKWEEIGEKVSADLLKRLKKMTGN